jgi:ribosomal protein L24
VDKRALKIAYVIHISNVNVLRATRPKPSRTGCTFASVLKRASKVLLERMVN